MTYKWRGILHLYSNQNWAYKVFSLSLKLIYSKIMYRLVTRQKVINGFLNLCGQKPENFSELTFSTCFPVILSALRKLLKVFAYYLFKGHMPWCCWCHHGNSGIIIQPPGPGHNYKLILCLTFLNWKPKRKSNQSY